MNNQSIFAFCIRICISTALAVTTSFFFLYVSRADNPQAQAGYPTRVTIPTIGLDQKIQPVGIIPVIVDGNTYFTWDVLDNHVGWHNRSALLGQTGNTVLSGHSNVKGRVFYNLYKLHIGDEITIMSGEQSYRYRITQKLLVQEKGASIETRIKNAQWIASTEDERLTLVTCAQPGATHRLIVVARPVSKIH